MCVIIGFRSMPWWRTCKGIARHYFVAFATPFVIRVTFCSLSCLISRRTRLLNTSLATTLATSFVGSQTSHNFSSFSSDSSVYHTLSNAAETRLWTSGDTNMITQLLLISSRLTRLYPKTLWACSWVGSLKEARSCTMVCRDPDAMAMQAQLRSCWRVDS